MSRVRLLLVALSALFLCAEYSVARTVALALSGGGARGLAHIGVLQLLEEEKLQPNLIVGTSMGAVVGGLYAAGYSAAEMKAIALAQDWSNLFFDRPARRNLFLGKKETMARHILSVRFRGWEPEVPIALTKGQRFSEVLFRLVHQAPYQPWSSFDDLRVPFRAVATDLVSGQPVVFRRGDLAEAMRATISLPLILTPYEMDTLLLVDGGVTENIPVEIARAEGADIVIGVDVTTGFDPAASVELPWELADRVTTLMHLERNRMSRQQADVMLTPAISTHSSTDFSRITELIDAGYRAAREKLPELRAAFAQGDTMRSGVPFASQMVYQNFRRETPARLLPPKGYVFSGVNLLPDSLLNRLPAGSDGLARLVHVRRAYVDEGLSQAHATFLRMAPDSTLYSHWEEGRIRRIEVKGLRRYRPWTVLTEFPLREGQLFDERRARRGIGQIHGSDLFETVTVSVLPSDSGTSVTIRVRERPSPQLRFGAGYSLARRGRGYAELLNDNVLNTGARLALFGKYGEMDEELRANVAFDRMPFRTAVDRLLQSDLTMDLRGGWSRQEFRVYDAAHRSVGMYVFERRGGEFWLGRAFRRWSELAGGVRYESVRGEGDVDEHHAYMTLIGARAIIDTKDSYPFPTSGAALRGQYEYALRSRSQGRAFNRLVATVEGFLPLSRRWVLRGKADYAWNDRMLPLWGQFALGGEESLLGLHVAERMGNCRVGALGELRYDLISRWLADAYLSAQYTVGAATRASDPYPRAREYQHGVGVSFALSTLLGPMRFTVGELLRSRFGPPQTRFYLNLGHEF